MCFAVVAAPSSREQINKQLNETIIPKVGNLDGFTIEEMIQVLYKNSNKINFLYFPPKPKPKVDTFLIPTNAPPPFGGVDPFANQPLPQFPPVGLPAPAPVEKDQAPKMKIVTGELNNLTVKQFMDIMVMGCVPPIQYVVMDYGVVFLPQTQDKAYMPLRLYRLNRNVFSKQPPPNSK